MGPIILFQIFFSFIYNIFNKKFSVSTKKIISKYTLIVISKYVPYKKKFHQKSNI